MNIAIIVIICIFAILIIIGIIAIGFYNRILFRKKKVEDKLNSIKENLKERNEINITGDEIAHALNKKPNDYLKDITKDIEKKILYSEITNNKEDIIKYVKENYMED